MSKVLPSNSGPSSAIYFIGQSNELDDDLNPVISDDMGFDRSELVNRWRCESPLVKAIYDYLKFPKTLENLENFNNDNGKNIKKQMNETFHFYQKEFYIEELDIENDGGLPISAFFRRRGFQWKASVNIRIPNMDNGYNLDPDAEKYLQNIQQNIDNYLNDDNNHLDDVNEKVNTFVNEQFNDINPIIKGIQILSSYLAEDGLDLLEIARAFLIGCLMGFAVMTCIVMISLIPLAIASFFAWVTCVLFYFGAHIIFAVIILTLLMIFLIFGDIIINLLDESFGYYN
ncbi:MAG: hypothetical protein WDZ28_05575 [Simkaniaceae bacterium]